MGAIMMNDVMDAKNILSVVKEKNFWMDMMEYWTGGGDDSIFTALCHCNQVNHKINNAERRGIETMLMRKHDEEHTVPALTKDKVLQPWGNLSTKLYECSVTENEDSVTAILDIVGEYLSKLSAEEKLKLTYRGKFAKVKIG